MATDELLICSSGFGDVELDTLYADDTCASSRPRRLQRIWHRNMEVFRWHRREQHVFDFAELNHSAISAQEVCYRRENLLDARSRLLAKEKEFARLQDEIAALRCTSRGPSRETHLKDPRESKPCPICRRAQPAADPPRSPPRAAVRFRGG